MTQPPFDGNDRFNQQGPPGQAGFGGRGQQGQQPSYPQRPANLGPQQYSAGQYGQPPLPGQQGQYGRQGSPAAYGPRQPEQPGQPDRARQPDQPRRQEHLDQPAQPRKGGEDRQRSGSGLLTVLAAIVGLLGIAGFVLGFFEALSVVTGGEEIPAGKTIVVSGAVPVLLLAAGVIALGTLIRSVASAAAWLATGALSVATGLGAGAMIYLYSSGDYSSAPLDVNGPQYKVQIGLLGSAGVAALMFVLGTIGYFAAVKSSKAILQNLVAQAVRAELAQAPNSDSGQLPHRVVAAATEAATAAATALVNARLAELQRASDRRTEPAPVGLPSSAVTQFSDQGPEAAPTEVTRSPFAHSAQGPSGQGADSAPILLHPATDQRAADTHADFSSAAQVAEVSTTGDFAGYGSSPAGQAGGDEGMANSDLEVTQMTRLPPAEQLRAAAYEGTDGQDKRPPTRGSAPVDTPRWQPSDRSQRPKEQDSSSSVSSAAADSGGHPQPADEPTMRYRAMPQAEPESYVWPIQQQPLVVDPQEQAPTYSENPDFQDPVGHWHSSQESAAPGSLSGPAPRAALPHEWNLQPPQYPPAPQDTARYAAAWDDPDDSDRGHPGEGTEHPWPSIPRAE